MSDYESHVAEFDELKRTLMAGDFVLPSGKTANEVVEEHAELFAGHNRILDVLMGSTYTEPDGTVIRRKSEGLVAKVERIDTRLINGGVKVRLPVMAWVAIVVAVIGGGFQIAAALIR